MIRVLFVCLGNICRSPMAEAVFRDLVEKEKLQDKITIDSAGIGRWHVGEIPHKGTREVLDKQQIAYEGIRARQVHKNDWTDFDYIIAMDDQNIKDLIKMSDKNDTIVVAKLMDFVDDPKDTNVPDPYFTGDFSYTYELILEGCKNLLESIRRKHNIYK